MLKCELCKGTGKDSTGLFKCLCQKIRCELCGEKIEWSADWSQKDALQKYEEDFDPAGGQPTIILCGDCYKKFVEYHHLTIKPGVDTLH